MKTLESIPANFRHKSKLNIFYNILKGFQAIIPTFSSMANMV
jgi:hypothetical protein